MIGFLLDAHRVLAVTFSIPLEGGLRRRDFLHFNRIRFSFLATARMRQRAMQSG